MSVQTRRPLVHFIFISSSSRHRRVWYCLPCTGRRSTTTRDEELCKYCSSRWAIIENWLIMDYSCIHSRRWWDHGRMVVWMEECSLISHLLLLLLPHHSLFLHQLRRGDQMKCLLLFITTQLWWKIIRRESSCEVCYIPSLTPPSPFCLPLVSFDYARPGLTVIFFFII